MPDPRIWPIVSSADGFATVAAVSTQVLAANADRGDTELVNDSEYVIYLARGNAAVVGSGIRLNQRGGSYHLGTDNMWYGVVNGISAGDDANLTVSEGNA